MKEEELSELYLKFPAILKEKLKNGEVSFPKETQFKYMPITAYRAIERTEEDSTPINRNDFRSYAEMKKKKTRGRRVDTSKLEYYRVSFFTKREIVENLLAFPNPKKKMICGEVYCEGGPHLPNEQTHHICWWLFETVNLDKFSIC